MKYTKEEVFAVLLGQMGLSDSLQGEEIKRIHDVAKSNDLSGEKVLEALKKFIHDEYDDEEVLKCITNADEDFKDLLFFGCLRVVVTDEEISNKEIAMLHHCSERYFEWSSTYVTIKLLRLLKDNPKLEIIIKK